MKKILPILVATVLTADAAAADDENANSSSTQSESRSASSENNNTYGDNDGGGSESERREAARLGLASNAPGAPAPPWSLLAAFAAVFLIRNPAVRKD